jgi:hypothetical protein
VTKSVSARGVVTCFTFINKAVDVTVTKDEEEHGLVTVVVRVARQVDWTVLAHMREVTISKETNWCMCVVWIDFSGV